MGIRLVVEVLDHAPPDLTPAEVLVLVAIAEEARDTTREAWPGMRKLARRTRLDPDSVRRVLQRLAARGLEIRRELGLGSDGRQYYTQKGVTTVYRLPAFFTADRRDADPATRGDQRPAAPDQRRDHNPATVSVEAGPQSRPSPQRPSAARAAVTFVMAKTDATEDEAAAVVTAVVEQARPRNVMGLLTTMARDGDLVEWLARTRQAGQGDDRLSWLSWLDGQPECEHGVAGGHVADQAGWTRCAVWRRRSATQNARVSSREATT